MKLTSNRIFGLVQAVIVAVAAMSFGTLAGAQPMPGDPPGRVARLSDLSGQVWLYNPDRGEWESAARNRPLTRGDRLATDPGARAVLQVGSATLRLDSGTELEVLALDDDHLSLQLHNGSVAARVRDLAGLGQFELSTEEGHFIVQRAGRYRFDRGNRISDATVYSGLARYEGPNSGLPVGAGQRAEFWLDAAGAAQYSLSAPVNDAFAGWNADRDRRAAGRVADRYVSPEMTGADDLDRYGRWEQNSDYGSLWIPANVAPDWAPYRYGRWAWVQPWGWTWVDDAPWGFAPFHYGRWVYVSDTWCWTPGVRVLRPVYAPALVAWVGGPRVDVSISIGGGGPAVGWFPLAPREVYVPSYRVSPRYAREINITSVTNVTQITNVYNNPQAPREFENRRFPHAITVVPAGVLTERRPVAPAAAQLRQTPWVRELAHEPTRATALLAPPVAAPASPARTLEPRAVLPPPGAGARPDITRPGLPPSQRTEQQVGPREADRPGPTIGPRPAAPNGTVKPAAPAAATVNPVTSPPTIRPPAQPAPPRPQFDNSDRRPEPQNGVAPSHPAPAEHASERAPAAAPLQPAAPANVPPHPVAAQPTPERPLMRAQPVPRAEERRVLSRPEAPANPPRPAPQAEPPMAPRPVEIQRAVPVHPAPVPKAHAPEPPARAEPPTRDEQKRGDPHDPREPQR